jgi:hypothetical protein
MCRSNFRGWRTVHRALCEQWASEEFQEKSKKKRNCATKGVNHTFGGDGYIRTAKRMVRYHGVLS